MVPVLQVYYYLQLDEFSSFQQLLEKEVESFQMFPFGFY